MFSLAKITSNRKNNGLCKLLSDSELFDFDRSEYSLTPYSPESLLEDGHLYILSNFSSRDFYPKWMGKVNDSKNFAAIENKDFSSISYIFEVYSNGDLAFQLASSNTYIKEKGFIKLGENVEVENKKTIFIIKSKPDVFYEKSTDSLIFKNLSNLDRIFSGANDLFREATAAEVTHFLSSSFIKLDKNFDTPKVSVLNRKKISSCLSSFFKLSIPEQKTILSDIINYKPTLFCSKTKKYIVDCDESLKHLLYGLEERYFTTKATKKKKVANSVIAA